MVRRRPRRGSPPPLDVGKAAPSYYAPDKVPASSSPRSSDPLPGLLDCLLEGVARAEGRNLLRRNLHLLAGLGVSPLPGLALPDGELPEARDLDLLATLERLGHDLLEGREVLLGIALGHPSLLCDPLDKLLLLHGCSLLWSDSAHWRACLGCLSSCLYGRRNSLPPPRSRWVWRDGCCWGVLPNTYHIWCNRV